MAVLVVVLAAVAGRGAAWSGVLMVTRRVETAPDS